MSSSNDARLLNLLGAATLAVGDAVDVSIAGATGLDAAASTALVAMLDFAPAGSVQLLSQVVGLTHSGAVRLVDRLVEAGHVERRPGADARSRAVVLTASGRRVARRARRARERALADIAGQLTDSEQATLSALAERVVEVATTARLDRRLRGEPMTSGALCRLCDFTACGRPVGRCPAERVARQ
jgi:DNA-binding MarR family transcriptional regulator